ncbi:MAG: hypothetical protein ACPMAG_08030 [Limisphaerales bacterium]
MSVIRTIPSACSIWTRLSIQVRTHSLLLFGMALILRKAYSSSCLIRCSTDWMVNSIDSLLM